MKLSNEEKTLFESYIKEANEASFQGWDFSYMAQYGGNVEESLEWNYKNVVIPQFRSQEILCPTVEYSHQNLRRWVF